MYTFLWWLYVFNFVGALLNAAIQYYQESAVGVWIWLFAAAFSVGVLYWLPSIGIQ